MLIFGYAVVFLILSLIVQNGHFSPIIEYEKGVRYEEYIVEHEISATQAKNSVLSIDLNSITTPPGCHSCTKAEIRYCLGRDLVNDHCCCDRRYTEFLPFIPHTCYMGPVICKPVIGDCAEYNRLRECCCQKHVIEKWKKRSAGALQYVDKYIVKLMIVIHFLYKLYI